MRYIFGILFLVSGGFSLEAQDLAFVLDQEKAGPGDSVRICLSTKNFTDIISMQFTLTWDSSVLAYQKVDDIQLAGASSTNFNEDLVSSGRLPFVWFDPNGGGTTLEEGSSLFCLYFTAIGALGDSSLLNLSDQPTPIEIGRLDGSSINAIPLELETGKVDIVENPLEISATPLPSNCFSPAEGSLSIEHENGVPPFSYSWTGPEAFTSTSKDLDQLAPGTYRLELRDSLGRNSTFSYQIQGPEAALSGNATATPADCNTTNGSLLITAEGGTAPYTFDLNGATNTDGQFTGLAAGEYLVLITDANDCMIDVSASISENTGGQTVDLGADQQVCAGDSLTLMAPNDLQSYSWFRNNQALPDSGPNLTVNTEGNYRLEATSRDGCILSDEVRLSFSTLTGSASGDTEIERGDSTQLNASQGNNYQWSPASGLSCTDCRSPKAAPETSTTYFVQFETIDGCPAMDSVQIRVTIPEDELRFVPVTFLSPNGDGENDELFFPGLDTYRSNDIDIFSRWGQLIYSKIDYQISGELWDGTLNGKRVPAGIYYYIIRVDEQNITVKRHLTIVY